MGNIFSRIGLTLKQNKAVFWLLVLASVLAIVLAAFAAINFSSGVFAIDLGNIAYIKFLKGDCGFVSLIFNLILNLFIFFALIILFGCKKFLFPFSVLFYLYFVYSVTVVIISIIMIYGFFNCIILALLLFIFYACLITLFLLLVLDLLKFCGVYGYFKSCFSVRESCIVWYGLTMLILVIAFCFIISILKSFILLLIY